MSMRLRFVLRPVLPLLVVTGLTGLAACSQSEPPQAAAAQAAAPVPTVGVVKVKLGQVAVAAELPGRLEAARSADLRARAGVVVLKRLFAEGSVVKAGQPLFQMDDTTYADAVLAAKATLAKAQANWVLADAKLKRYQPMAEKDIVSKQDFDVVVSAEKAALADLAAAKAQLANAQTNLNRTTITAPIAGTIGRALVSEGDLLNANDATVVAQIKDSSTLYINFTQSASQVLQMRRDLASGTLKRAEGAEAAEVKIVLEDGSIFPTPGRLLFTDMTVDEGTGQVQLRAAVPNAQGLLLPGLFVKVRIEQSAVANAVLVPQQALTRGSQGDSVLVVNKDGSFAPRSVQVRARMNNAWAVTDGLADGEQVLVSGQMKLMPGVSKVQAVPYQELEAAAQAAHTASAPVAAAAKK